MFGTAKERQERLKELRESAGVHRLIEMIVQENSLVDLAANKKRFLLVKRAMEEADMKITLPAAAKEAIIKVLETASSQLSTVLEAVKTSKAVEGAVLAPGLDVWVRGTGQGLLKAIKEFPSPALKDADLGIGDDIKIEPDSLEKKDFELSTESQTAIVKEIEDAQGKLGTTLEVIKAAEVTEDKMETPLPDDIGETLKTVAASLAGIGKTYAKKEESKVNKAGAPLSKDKVKLVSDAKTLLERLLSQVAPGSKKSLPLGQEDTLRSGTDPNHANAGSGLQPSAEDVATALEFFKKVPGLAEALKAQGLDTEGLQDKLKKAEEALKVSQGVVKSQETTIEKQATSLKEVPGGNAGGEDEVNIEKNLPAESPWSSDMAKPDDKASVEARGSEYFGKE